MCERERAGVLKKGVRKRQKKKILRPVQGAIIKASLADPLVDGFSYANQTF